MSLIRTNDDFLMRLLSASAMRHRVIANNIANSNTPGYRRNYVSFEDRLLDELKSSKPEVNSIMPEVQEDHLTPTGFDGNNVSMEVEMNSLNENRIMYEMYSSILATKTEMLRASIQDR